MALVYVCWIVWWLSITRVDSLMDISFYHLTHSTTEKALPQLLQKMLDKGHRAVILSDDKERLSVLNNWLWEYSPEGVIPHGLKGEQYPEAQPVYLTWEEENPNQADILIVLGNILPANDNGFVRCLDMFEDGDAEGVADARKRWAHYQEQGGSNLTYWQQTANGGWEKK